MKKRLIACALCLVAAAGVSTVAGAHGTSEAEATIPVGSSAGGDIYIDQQTQGLWQETNGHAGLQTTEHVSGTTTFAPDKHLLSLVPPTP